MKQKSQNWFFYKTPCFMNLHNYAEYICIWYERTINFGLWFKKTIVIKTSSVSWNLHSKSERKLEFNLWRYLIEHEKNQSTENNISLLLFVGVFGLQCRTGDVQSWSDDPSAMCKILHWRSRFNLRGRVQGPQRTSVQYRLRFQSQDVKYCFTFFLCHFFSPWSIIWAYKIFQSHSNEKDLLVFHHTSCWISKSSLLSEFLIQERSIRIKMIFFVDLNWFSSLR